MQSTQDIFEQLRGVLHELFEIDPSRVTLEAHLYNDLEIDSIDTIDLILRLKEITGRKIQPDQFRNVRTIGDAVSAIQKVEKELAAPLSVQTSFQGNAQAFGASLKSTPILIGASLFVIYLILGILYESLIHPITIISTLPSAGVGALLLLMAVHVDLSVIAIVGIILLIGIVKKNGIMLVDFAQHVEHTQGLSAEESIYQACILRFRPILMTTMAALLGGVPMMLGTGVGSEIRQPLGYAIVGGLALSQILTLYTTPVVYLYLDELQTRMSRWRAKPASPAGQAPAGPVESQPAE